MGDIEILRLLWLWLLCRLSFPGGLKAQELGIFSKNIFPACLREKPQVLTFFHPHLHPGDHLTCETVPLLSQLFPRRDIEGK